MELKRVVCVLFSRHYDSSLYPKVWIFYVTSRHSLFKCGIIQGSGECLKVQLAKIKLGKVMVMWPGAHAAIIPLV